MGAIFVELCMVFEYFIVRDGDSLLQSALPLSFSNTGFFQWITHCCFKSFSKYYSRWDIKRKSFNISLFQEIIENFFAYSFPSTVSLRLGLRFDVINIFEISSGAVWAYLYSKGSVPPKLPTLSITTEIKLYPLVIKGF